MPASAPGLRVLIALERNGGPGGEWSATVLTAIDGIPTSTEPERRGPHDAPGPLLEELGLDLDEAETKAIVGARKPPPPVETTHRRRPR